MIACEDGRCRVEGPLTIENITGVLDESKRLFTAREITVDFAAVTDVDSSAVSLLMQWQRAARADGKAITYVNLPPNLKSLAALYGVAELIPGAA
ncbi:MAG TPA: STAS domain-containing protein [Burkholderiales bacterium]|nr:STAS domain-containing protein [Burkholderiales bacterium]